MEQTLIRSLHNMLVLRGLDGVDHPLSDVTLVGREAECQLQLIEGHASRYHAKLTVTGPQQVLVEDLKSTNGTFVNGQRVETPMVATLGDELRFDTSRFRIATMSSGGANATVFRNMKQDVLQASVQPSNVQPVNAQPFNQEIPKDKQPDLEEIERNRIWDRSSVPSRNRETVAPLQPQPQPRPQPTLHPKPAPQMMTPAPQQPDIAMPEAATPAPAPAETWVDADIAPTTELPLAAASNNGLIIEHSAGLDQTSLAGIDASRTTVDSTSKKPVDENLLPGRDKQKKVAQFLNSDGPVTGTSSLPAEELANLAAKSSRTVRRTESTQGPRLIVLNPPARGMIFPLDDSGAVGEWLVGRGEDADVALTDRTVSVRHAFIRKTGSRWEIENLNATNGVFVNGKLVSRRIVVNGDKVRLGRTEMQFRTDSDPGAEIAEATPPSSSFLTPGVLLGLAGAVFVALFVLILILVLQRGP